MNQGRAKMGSWSHDQRPFRRESRFQEKVAGAVGFSANYMVLYDNMKDLSIWCQARFFGNVGCAPGGASRCWCGWRSGSRALSRSVSPPSSGTGPVRAQTETNLFSSSITEMAKLSFERRSHHGMQQVDRRSEHFDWIETALRVGHLDLPNLVLAGPAQFDTRLRWSAARLAGSVATLDRALEA